jgi:CRP/FNR family transcriptional regulator, anaerobic regulatory protein
MFETLRSYFECRFALTDEHFDFIKKFFLGKHLKKGGVLLREGEVAKYSAFVEKGCLRSFVIDNKGKEHIVLFAPENWWITDSESIRNGTPATYFIDAIEESDILLLDTPSHLKLLEQVPGYASAFQTGVQKHAAAKDRRIVASLAATAEERYNDFLKTYPSIAQRVPQHMLASYLGITPETLSRIRKQLSRRK